MKVLILVGFIAVWATAGAQRRGGSQRRTTPPDDVLPIFGATPEPDSSPHDVDTVSFSVTDAPVRVGGNGGRRGSGPQSSRGSFTNGGQVGGSSNSDDSSLGGASDTGFDRLTTQSPGRGISGGTDQIADAIALSGLGSGRGSSGGRQRPSAPDRDTGSGSSDGNNGFSSGSGSDNGDGSRGSSGSRRSPSRPSGGSVDMGSSDMGSGSSRSSGRLTRFPDNFRIETEVQRVENPKGTLANGANCDYLSKCDTKVYAYIDTEKPQNPFPGAVPVKKWPAIFSVTNNDSPTITKVVTRDVCGTSVTQANLRSYVVDTDSVSAEDEIGKFECQFPLTADGIASDQPSSRWSDSMECKAFTQVGKIKLFARQRAYQISSSNCNSQTL